MYGKEGRLKDIVPENILLKVVWGNATIADYEKIGSENEADLDEENDDVAIIFIDEANLSVLSYSLCGCNQRCLSL